MRVLPFVVLVACGPPAPTWHADVRPIVEGRCASCHSDGGVAPFALGSHEDVAAVGELVGNAVGSGAMPPWPAVPADVAFDGDPSLSDEQIATVEAWVDAGMPEGDPEDAGEPLPPVSVPLPRADVQLRIPEPYTPDPSRSDDYRCFLIDWSTPGTSYVTGFEVFPDNRSVVHHVAAFLVRPDGLAGPGVIDTFRAFDDAADGPGYPCFGGPSGDEAVQVPIQQIAQWVPGSGAVLFPERSGIAVPDGSLVVLQLHYNTLSSDGLPDQTSVDLTLEPSVDRVGAFAPWLDALWPLVGMPLPPGERTTHVAEGDPRAFFELLNEELDLSAGFDIHASMLHMHTLGREALVRLDREGGSSMELLRIDDWDFDWQISYRFAEPVAFEPGDALHLSCTFDNDRPEEVSWGEGTGDEMCVANLFITARTPVD